MRGGAEVLEQGVTYLGRHAPSPIEFRFSVTLATNTYGTSASSSEYHFDVGLRLRESRCYSITERLRLSVASRLRAFVAEDWPDVIEALRSRPPANCAGAPRASTGAVHSGRSVMLLLAFVEETCTSLSLRCPSFLRRRARTGPGRLEERRADFAVAVAVRKRGRESALRALPSGSSAAEENLDVPRGAEIFDDMAPKGFKPGRRGPPRMKSRALFAVRGPAAISSAPTLGAAPAPSAPTPQTLDALLQRRIKHVFVIYQENRSFDSEFGTFPGAQGVWSAQARTHGFTQTDPVTGRSVTPFRLTDPDVYYESNDRAVQFRFRQRQDGPLRGGAGHGRSAIREERDAGTALFGRRGVRCITSTATRSRICGRMRKTSRSSTTFFRRCEARPHPATSRSSLRKTV